MSKSAQKWSKMLNRPVLPHYACFWTFTLFYPLFTKDAVLYQIIAKWAYDLNLELNVALFPQQETLWGRGYQILIDNKKLASVRALHFNAISTLSELEDLKDEGKNDGS